MFPIGSPYQGSGEDTANGIGLIRATEDCRVYRSMNCYCYLKLRAVSVYKSSYQHKPQSVVAPDVRSCWIGDRI
jgi:hypothetical protein